MAIKQEFPLSKEAFLYMTMLAHRCGIELSDYRKNAIYHRLVKRLHFLNIPDFDTYCNLLRLDLEEEMAFINLITNCTTQFFREHHHFDFLAKNLLPELIKNKHKIRIWSAGCATGEEAYSIAMTVLETLHDIKQYDIKILATDINSDALTTAQLGVYPQAEIMKQLNLFRRKTWFEPVANDSNLYQVKNELKEFIYFQHVNLVDVFPMHGPFDAIFCRNVIIYFNPDIAKRILAKLHRVLGIGGVLFLGHSETVQEFRENYHSLGKTIYRKIR